MKKICLLFTILVFAQISCNHFDRKVPYEDFIEHLNQVDELLNDSILYRWRVWNRYDEDNSNCLLWYDTGVNPMYDKYGEFCDVNSYNVNTGKPVSSTHTLDTAFLCKCWDIEKDSFQARMEIVCQHIRDITGGYRINEMSFCRNGYCVFLSAYNNWGVVCRNDSTTNDKKMQEYELMLIKNGYSQVGNTRFWVNKPMPNENNKQ